MGNVNSRILIAIGQACAALIDFDKSGVLATLGGDHFVSERGWRLGLVAERVGSRGRHL